MSCKNLLKTRFNVYQELRHNASITASISSLVTQKKFQEKRLKQKHFSVDSMQIHLNLYIMYVCMFSHLYQYSAIISRTRQIERIKECNEKNEKREDMEIICILAHFMYIIVINYNVDGGSNYETFSSSLTNYMGLAAERLRVRNREVFTFFSFSVRLTKNLNKLTCRATENTQFNV